MFGLWYSRRGVDSMNIKSIVARNTLTADVSGIRKDATIHARGSVEADITSLQRVQYVTSLKVACHAEASVT